MSGSGLWMLLLLLSSSFCRIYYFARAKIKAFSRKIRWSPDKSLVFNFTVSLELHRIHFVQGRVSGTLLAAKGAQRRASDSRRRTCSLLTAPCSCPKQTYKGKATRWIVIPGPAANRASTSVAGKDLSPLWISAQVSIHLFPLLFLSYSDLAKGYRWDCKCPPDTAIKFHFEIMHAKVSLNPSLR